MDSCFSVTIFFNKFRIFICVIISRLVTGSSQIKMSGLASKARAMQIRCAWPPLTVLLFVLTDPFLN
ncbi:hypothetical protein ABMB67_000360 [Halalkalibacter oceani]